MEVVRLDLVEGTTSFTYNNKKIQKFKWFGLSTTNFTYNNETQNKIHLSVITK
jgi:hypothetical protein